jgi:hypothetical protein
LPPHLLASLGVLPSNGSQSAADGCFSPGALAAGAGAGGESNPFGTPLGSPIGSPMPPSAPMSAAVAGSALGGGGAGSGAKSLSRHGSSRSMKAGGSGQYVLSRSQVERGKLLELCLAVLGCSAQWHLQLLANR